MSSTLCHLYGSWGSDLSPAYLFASAINGRSTDKVKFLAAVNLIRRAAVLSAAHLHTYDSYNFKSMKLACAPHAIRDHVAYT
eukprot:209301-Pleurochrysis_carterae.AAC.1